MLKRLDTNQLPRDLNQLDKSCKLLLCADSWGVPHLEQGLSTHLNEYIPVQNISCGGYNNFDILDSMECALQYHQYTYTVFIQSDLLRHRRDSNSDVLPHHINLEEILKSRQTAILDRLENIQSKYNTTILCLGGLSRIDDYHDYNLNVVMPSILNFLDKNIDTEKYSVHDGSGDLKLMGNLKHKDVSVWLEASDNYMRKYTRMMREDISIQDGCHLNSNAFLKVSQNIKKWLTS